MLLESLRIFGSGYDIHSLPWFSWERLAAGVLIFGAYAFVWRSFGAWNRAMTVASIAVNGHALDVSQTDREHKMIRIGFNEAYAPLAGAILFAAQWFWPDEVSFHLREGFASFREIGPGGWAILFALYMAASLALYHVVVAFRAYGKIFLLDAIPYILIIPMLFSFGWLLGPLIVFFTINPKVVKVSWLAIGLFHLLTTPFLMLVPSTWTGEAGQGRNPIKRAMEKAGGRIH